MSRASVRRSVSAGVVVATIWPRRRTLMRSATSSTSSSLCEMKTTLKPCAAMPRSVWIRLCGLLRREDGGRLVEDEDARTEIEQAQDLHPLLLADRELPDLGSRIDAETVALAQLGQLALDPRRLQIDA